MDPRKHNWKSGHCRDIFFVIGLVGVDMFVDDLPEVVEKYPQRKKIFTKKFSQFGKF